MSQLAIACECALTTIANWKRSPDFPEPRDGLYSVFLVGVWRGRKLETTTNKRPGVDDDEMGDADSPGLERYRLAKAALAELDLAERQKTLLPADTVRDSVNAIALAFRQAGETLQRQFGVEAHAILESAVSEAEAQINDMFGSDEHDSDGIDGDITNDTE